MANKRLSRSQEYVKKSVSHPSKAQAEREERKQKRELELAKRRYCESPEPAPSIRRKAKNVRRRIMYLLILAALLLALSIQAFHIYSLVKEREELALNRYALEKEKARLEEELKNVNSTEYVEQQAREQLKLIMPGETLYIFPKKEEANDGN
jgi:cell division protein FtsB